MPACTCPRQSGEKVRAESASLDGVTLRQFTSSAEYACQADSHEAWTLSSSSAWHKAAQDCLLLPAAMSLTSRLLDDASLL